jgi:hypothetical protein
LALVVPASSSDGEWYAADAPPSPLAPALSGLPWDSLPPITVNSVAPAGQWRALEVRRGREEDKRVIIAGSDTPRRLVVVSASGLWKWRFRPAASADGVRFQRMADGHAVFAVGSGTYHFLSLSEVHR